MPGVDGRRRAISAARPARGLAGRHANRFENPPGQFGEVLRRNFPYVLFDIPPNSDGDVTVRKIGAHGIAHLRTASWAAEAAVGHADAHGFGKTIKLVWQLSGAMIYEDQERALSINAGEIFLTRSSSNYFLNTSKDYESLVLTFDASANPAWLNLVERGETELVLKPNSAAAASAAGCWRCCVNLKMTARASLFSIHCSSWQRGR